MGKRAKPARGKAFGILNPYGDLWTYSTFETEAEARKYIADFWRGLQGEERLDRFKVIPVKVTVSDGRSVATPAGGEDGRHD